MVNDDRQLLIFAEKLSLISWIFNLLPYAMHHYFTKRNKIKIYYIDSSRSGKLVGLMIARLTKYQIARLDFRLVDIKDENGNLLRLRIAYQDMHDVQKEILGRPFFQRVLQAESVRNRLPSFLTKRTISFDTTTNRSFFRELLLIHVAIWKNKNTAAAAQDCVVFMRVGMWLQEIRSYASKYGVKVVPVSGDLHIDLKKIVKRNPLLRKLYFMAIGKLRGNRLSLVPKSPRLALDYYGHFNLGRPELHSDLFFWQQSELPGKDIVITFALAKDPLDKNKLAELEKHNMQPVILTPQATRLASVPVYAPPINWKQKVELRVSPNKLENNWLNSQIKDYDSLYNYWHGFFSKNNIKMYLSWYKYDGNHCVIADALRELGGAMAIYQRAFEECSSPETMIDADVVFGFSKEVADLERGSGSIIPYHVVTGYFGDHRFPLLEKPAQELRGKLQKSGAKHIIAFFDENSREDSRWHTGSQFMRDNYRFLLEKALAEPWLGLVFKPKVPSTLRKRLGDVAELLKRAEATGRCFVFEGGALHGSYPPAIAALASDVTIHGHLCAATAGVEAALAGVPTLLMDREGWPVSKLYRLGKGQVVFDNWDEAWAACMDHWHDPSGIPGFGDWSSMLDEIDPFRDGRAAERIGTYLKWLLDGFKAGLPRETVLADAAERYVKIWGKDKISTVNCTVPEVKR
ncbi:MAG: hypothetical protein ABIC39_06335 [Pseudomonadota bacterium]